MELKLKSKTIALAVTAALATTAFSQEATPAPESSADDSTLDTMLVTGAQVPASESILPTVRPFNSVYGMDLSILDTPRNVTIISREQLDAINIQDVRDFSKLTSSSYTPTNFGAPSNASIRGLSGDTLQNGIRRGLTSNGNGMPINFNAIESVNIVKGPPPVTVGVSSYVGGYVDYITKRPYLSKFTGEVSFTAGMYDQYRWALDFGGPITDQLAYRISYSGEESGSYYENGNKNTEAIYGAITWMPSSNYTLELNAEMFFADYTENWGINRPTQELIDDGKYQTGFLAFDANEDGVIDNKDVAPNYNPVTFGDTIDIDRSRRLLDEGDGSYGRQFNAQMIQTLNVNDSYTVVNNTYFQYIKRQTKSSYYYSEIIDGAYLLANKLENRINFDIPFGSAESAPASMSKDDKDSKKVVLEQPEKPFVLGNSIDVGVEFRYQQVLAYNDFFHEPANAWDLSLSRKNIDFVNYTAGFFPSVPVPGYDGRFGSPGIINDDTNDSSVLTLAPFYEHVVKFGEHFNLLFGARLDILWIDVQDPLFDPDYEFGFPRGTASAAGLDGTDSTVVGIPNFNISPTYKPFPWLSTYFTYNYSQSIGVANGGGFPVPASSISVQDSLRQESQLFEVGAKASLLNETLFLGVAGFKQTRVQPSIGGTADEVEVWGFEVEANYQPNKYFYATLAYSYLDIKSLNGPSGFQAQTHPVDDPRYIIGGTPENPIVLTDASFNDPLPPGEYRYPGVPQHLINGLASYKHDSGFGASAGFVVTGPINNNWDGTLDIPWQYTVDLTVFYEDKNFRAEVAFLNLTDQENWGSPNPVYGTDSILAELPFRMEATVKYKF
ncbi:MAG TPA: TonB-dependent receptor [Chryseolinea sp.]